MNEYLHHFPMWLLFPLILWDIIWKLIALWKATKNDHRIWYIFIGITNTVGILPLAYIVLYKRRSNSCNGLAPFTSTSKRKENVE